MAGKKTKTLYNDQEKTKASVISTKLLAGNVEPEDCPWVQVGQLYLSLTITGEGSWLPLVRLLASQGKKKFILFTGRHGDVPNVVNKKNKETVGVFSEEHVDEDTGVMKAALKEAELKGVTIQLVDAGKSKINQTQWLKTETLKYLKDGAVVIYAWCYSIFTMFESVIAVGADDSVPDAFKGSLESANKAEIDKSVATLVKNYFSWVPK